MNDHWRFFLPFFENMCLMVDVGWWGQRKRGEAVLTGPDRSIYITSKKMPDQHTILKLLPHFLLPCSGHHTTSSSSSSSFSSCKVEIGKEVELDVDLYSLWGEVSAVFHNFQLCGKIQGNLVMAFDPFAAVHPRKLIELLLDAEPERERILDHFSAQNSSS